VCVCVCLRGWAWRTRQSCGTREVTCVCVCVCVCVCPAVGHASGQQHRHPGPHTAAKAPRNTPPRRAHACAAPPHLLELCVVQLPQPPLVDVARERHKQVAAVNLRRAGVGGARRALRDAPPASNLPRPPLHTHNRALHTPGARAPAPPPPPPPKKKKHPPKKNMTTHLKLGVCGKRGRDVGQRRHAGGQVVVAVGDGVGGVVPQRGVKVVVGGKRRQQRAQPGRGELGEARLGCVGRGGEGRRVSRCVCVCMCVCKGCVCKGRVHRGFEQGAGRRCVCGGVCVCVWGGGDKGAGEAPHDARRVPVHTVTPPFDRHPTRAHATRARTLTTSAKALNSAGS
jgi:hypothetical protein